MECKMVRKLGVLLPILLLLVACSSSGKLEMKRAKSESIPPGKTVTLIIKSEPIERKETNTPKEDDAQAVQPPPAATDDFPPDDVSKYTAGIDTSTFSGSSPRADPQDAARKEIPERRAAPHEQKDQPAKRVISPEEWWV